jgi:gamma-glutamylcyclotransferase (GGCT)/AIG2-like uncharacterized protein YtfP
MLPFFVYGTLKNGHGNYARQLAGKTTAERAATASGLLFDLGWFPMMIAGEGVVHGELMDVHPDHYDHVLESLDILEGVGSGFYNRVKISVKVDGRPMAAWGYVGTAEKVRGRRFLSRGTWGK